MNYNDILNILCCPACKSSIYEEVDLNLSDNKLVCNNMHYYPIKCGIPDLRLNPETEFAAKNYAEIHREFEFDTDRKHTDIWIKKNGLNASIINGKSVFVAGVGMGHELQCVDTFEPRMVVGIDYSDNIHRFPKLDVRNKGNTIYIQADIHNLPFKSNSFDFVFNGGVMQQLRSPELGFRQLYNVTRGGGIISIGSIYDQSWGNRIISIARWRHMFHKMQYDDAKKKIMRYGRISKLFGKFKLGIIPRSFIGEIRVVDSLGQMMDFYYPEYRHVIDPNEIIQWFNDVGIKEVQKGERQFVGRKQ